MQTKPIKLLTLVELGSAAVAVWLAFHFCQIVGVFTRHMMLHIVLMMLAAPALAGLLRESGFVPPLPNSIKSLSGAALLQAILFLSWHSPPGLSLAWQSGGGLMHITLLFSALCFWLAVFDQAVKNVWRAVFVLLLTGKLFCLLAVLLVFAPRVLYGSAILNSAISVDLGDQQLAGLLMLTACPLTYVFAAIVLVYCWFQRLCDDHSAIESIGLASESAS